MKVGFITTIGGYQWAGSEELWFNTALTAINQGHKVNVVIPSEMQSSSQIHNLSSLGSKIYIKSQLCHPRLTALKESLNSSFFKAISESDIVVVSMGSLLDPIFVTNLIKSLLSVNIPYILLCQFNAEVLNFSSISRLAIQRLFDSALGCVFVSQQNQLLAQRQLAKFFKNSVVIYNPIRCILNEPLPLLISDVIQFACVARLETLWKGQDVLLEVLSQSQWLDRSWHLNLYGTGQDENYIKQLIDHYNLAERVTFHGYVRDIESVWRQNHLMVLASRGEGTPLAVLEAMMCGRPTVTTDAGGNREILNNYETGWIAEAATPYSFSRALESAWEHREYWPKIGQAAHQAAKQISEANPAQQLLDYLLSLYFLFH